MKELDTSSAPCGALSPQGEGRAPEVGGKVRFVPAANVQATDGFVAILSREIIGTVVQVHEAHRWYRVRYELPGCIRW